VRARVLSIRREAGAEMVTPKPSLKTFLCCDTAASSERLNNDEPFIDPLSSEPQSEPSSDEISEFLTDSELCAWLKIEGRTTSRWRRDGTVLPVLRPLRG
jgi:hypothetical protein